MKPHLVPLGKGLMTVGLTGAVGYLIALATTQSRVWPWLFGLLGGLVAVGLVAYVIGQERPVLTMNQRFSRSVPTADADRSSEGDPDPWSYEEASLSIEPEASIAQEPPSGPPFTDLWHHTSDGFEATPLMTMTRLAMPGYFGMDDRPFVRIGVTVACDSIPPDSDSSEAGRKFIDFLNSGPVSTLATLMTRARAKPTWTRQAGNGLASLQAVLGTDASGRPDGSAMLNLPITGRHLFGRDNNAASLWLQFDPELGGTEVSPARLGEWHRRFVMAIDLSDALIDLLGVGFGMTCWDQPAARVGFMLETPGSTMTKLMDTRALATLPGANRSSQFLGYVIADRAGKPADEAARDLIRQLCDYTLQVDLTAEYLSMIGRVPDPGTRVYVPWVDGRREGTVVSFEGSECDDPRLIVKVAVADDADPLDLAFSADAVDVVQDALTAMKHGEVEPSFLVREAEANPSHVLLQAWEHLTAAIADIAGIVSPGQRATSWNTARSLPELVHRELVPQDFAEAVTELRRVRNQVAHGQSKPTPDEAVAYAESARHLALVARNIAIKLANPPLASAD